jgi:hypothetical protein
MVVHQEVEPHTVVVFRKDLLRELSPGLYLAALALPRAQFRGKGAALEFPPVPPVSFSLTLFEIFKGTLDFFSAGGKLLVLRRNPFQQ